MKRQTARADPRSVRQWNEYVVVTALRNGGAQRISDLATTTGLTPAPLGQVLRGLSEKGWVSAGEGTPNGRGRPAQVFTPRIPAGSAVGLDIGAHAVRAVRLDLEGTVIDRAELTLPADATSADRIEAVQAVLGRSGVTPQEVWLTALAVGGSLTPDGLIRRSVAVPDWDGLHPADIFADVLPGRSLVVNDVRAATWAEHTVGAAADHASVLLAQLGRRPTLGILFGEAPWRGAHGTAGDLSLNPFLPSEEQMDWLRGYRGMHDPIGHAVRDALAGDRSVQEDARRYVQDIAPALALATSVVDPSVLVLGGAIAPLAPFFLEDLTDHIHQHVQQPPAVVVTGLDQFAAALGAGLLALRAITDALADPHRGVLPLSREVFTESFVG